MMRTAASGRSARRPYPIRRILSACLLRLLGRAAALQQRFDAQLRSEWSIYPDGTTVALAAWPGGRPLVLRKAGGRFVPFRTRRAGGRTPFASARAHGSGGRSPEAQTYGADFEITFKSVRIAWPVLTGRKSTDQAYLEHSIVVRGDLMSILPLTRGLARVERMLLPRSRR